MRKCPKCSSVNVVKNGNHLNTQRYKCKQCGYQYTRKARKGRPYREKALAKLLYVNGVSMNAIAKILGVTPPAVSRWIRACDEIQPSLADDAEPRLMNFAEMVDYLDTQSADDSSPKLVVVLSLGSLSRNTGIVISPRRSHADM